MSEKSSKTTSSGLSRVRISLRGVLILITLVSIGLAIASNGPLRQRYAVAEFRELGATITYAMADEDVAESLVAKILGIDFVSNVEEVELVIKLNEEIPDVSGLRHLRGLERLKIGGSLEEKTFLSISNCHDLHILTFCYSNFEGDLLKNLQALEHLEMVVLRNTQPVSNWHIESSGQRVPNPRLSEFVFKRGYLTPQSKAREEFPFEAYQAWLRSVLPDAKVHEELGGSGFGGSSTTQRLVATRILPSR